MCLNFTSYQYFHRIIGTFSWTHLISFKFWLFLEGFRGFENSSIQISLEFKHDAHMKASLVHTRTRDVTKTYIMPSLQLKNITRVHPIQIFPHLLQELRIARTMYPTFSFGYPMKAHFSDLGLSLSGWNFFTYAFQPQTLRNDSLGFLLNHSSYGVISTDLDGALFNVNVAVSNA